jgi:hypothetical protein
MTSQISTNWEGIPHTRPTANLVELRKVTGAHVVLINNGSFRNASISGFFELASPSTQVSININGIKTIEVKLGWFGVKPPTSWANVTILDTYEIIDNFSGTVFHNISELPRNS